jgi:hypothetical protein
MMANVYRRVLAALAVIPLLCLPAVAYAEYPPGSFTGPAPAGLFPTVLTSQEVCSHGGRLLVSEGDSTIRVRVPPHAFRHCAQVTIYGIDEVFASTFLPDGSHLIVGFAIDWIPATNPTRPLHVVVRNRSITRDTAVFETTNSGIIDADNVAVGHGRLTADLRQASGIVVANVAEQFAERAVEQAVAGAIGFPGELPSTSLGDQQRNEWPTVGLAFMCLLAVSVAGWAGFRATARRSNH